MAHRVLQEMGWLDSLAQEALEALVAARSAWPQAQQVDQTLSRLGVQTKRAGDVRAGAGDGAGLGLVVESTATFRSRRQSPSLFSSGPEEEDEDEWVYDESQGSATNTPLSNPPRSQYAAFAPSFPHSPSPAQARAAQRLLSRLGVSSAEQWRQADAEQKRNLIVALAEQVSSPPHHQQQGQQGQQAAEGQAETILTALLQLGARWDSLPTRPRNKLALALARSLSSESDSARRRAAALSVGVGMRREVVPKQLRPLCLLGEGLLGSVE